MYITQYQAGLKKPKEESIKVTVPEGKALKGVEGGDGGAPRGTNLILQLGRVFFCF